MKNSNQKPKWNAKRILKISVLVGMLVLTGKLIGAAQQEPTHILGSQPRATCARVLLLHLHQGVTMGRPRSQNPHILLQPATGHADR